MFLVLLATLAAWCWWQLPSAPRGSCTARCDLGIDWWLGPWTSGRSLQSLVMLAAGTLQVLTGRVKYRECLLADHHSPARTIHGGVVTSCRVEKPVLVFLLVAFVRLLLFCLID
jgi:hypothetical protein